MFLNRIESKMNSKHTFLFFISFTSIALGEAFRYDNYTLYKILPENDEHVKVLQNVHSSDLRFDFWIEPAPSMDFGMILSSPQDKGDLENILKKHEIKYEIKMSNIQEAIDKEAVYRNARNTKNLTNMQWNVYYKLDQIYGWLDHLVETHQNVASIIIGGRSYEGRDIKGIRISHGSGKKAIFIEGGIHAREWISPSASCYVINELLHSTNSDIRAAAREFDWYIFPVTNPDGYVWSHEENRLWRKNRRPVNNNFGIDLNRNWNNNWMVAGSSVNPASDTYAGLGPFSEPETLSLSRYIRSMGEKIELYLSIHSFSQLLLIPFGNSTAPYGNYHDALNIGRRAMGALSVRYGTQYVVGNIAEAIYRATGGSIDWVKEHLQVPLVYCYELRDRGENGFLLPVDQILPNNQEFMDSVIELIYQAKRFGYMNNNANGVNAPTLMIVAIVIGALYRN